MLKNKHPRQRGQNFNEVPYQPSMKRYHLQGLGDELEGRFLLIRRIDELKSVAEAEISMICSINVVSEPCSLWVLEQVWTSFDNIGYS